MAHATVPVMFRDESYVIECYQTDFYRAEALTRTSASRRETPLAQWLPVVFCAMRRQKLEGVPGAESVDVNGTLEEFDAFLDLLPDVDLDGIETVAPKGSGRDRGTGRSSASRSKRASQSET